MRKEVEAARIDPAVAAKVRERFKRDGVAIAAWAKANGLSAPLVHRVLSGGEKCVRGDSYRAAVLLGLKPGNAENDPVKYDPRLASA